MFRNCIRKALRRVEWRRLIATHGLKLSESNFFFMKSESITFSIYHTFINGFFEFFFKVKPACHVPSEINLRLFVQFSDSYEDSSHRKHSVTYSIDFLHRIDTLQRKVHTSRWYVVRRHEFKSDSCLSWRKNS